MTGSPAGRAALRSLSAALISATAGTFLLVAGRRDLPLPGWSPGGWPRWWESAGPVVATFATVRMLLLATAAVLTVAFLGLAVGLVAPPGRGQARLRPAVRGLLRAAPMLRVVIGLSASGAALAACGSGPTPLGAAPIPPTLTNLAPRPAIRPSPPGSPSRPVVPPRPPIPVPLASSSVAPPATWRVRPGDSLWSIAQATVVGPPERVAPYWAALVRLNRARLPDPSDPSLIFPGDIVELPPGPAGGT